MSFQIILDNLSGVFYSGQAVSGRVELVVQDELKITAINFIAKGQANVHWQEGSGEHTRHYYGHEKYFHNKLCLFGKQQTGANSVKLAAGHYSYSFSVQLPPILPSSYEGCTGQVRYSLKAHIDIPWAFDKYTKRMITVVNPLDLNTLPNAQAGASNSGQKRLCCLCCESDPISATVMVDRTGYVPGEYINFRAEVNNQSKRTMTCTKAKLVMEVTYHATSKSRTVKHRITKLKHGELKGGDTDVWTNEKLHVPSVPPSFLRGCTIIDIKYYVTIVADPSGVGFDLEVPVEVVIGSIPLASVAEQHGFSLPTQTQFDVPPPPVGAPQGLYADTSIPTKNPQVSLSESAMGRVKIKEGKEGSGTVDYAPVYTYYNWDKPDVDSMFTVQRQ
ncbi:arrestin domain-containing protein 3-like [Mercenaria mercenaria]|uniref:arrestin domain-containing protein 3-like n=1 Tax=Mercenaria mercenaria TaxID=6596 RepID=UPI00234F3B6C|nr:arrestin domain-containing protein 3-like [Mercenaria mercenaria]XP_045216628.2 arrestin domain-containing protein 3-like [Mercenaria mercenaria]